MTEKKQRPALGEWRRVLGYAHKNKTRYIYELHTGVRALEKHEAANGRRITHATTEWVSYPCKPVDGMFIGWRTMRNGITRIENDGYGNYAVWEHNKTVEVWIFVIDARQKPIYAFPEDVVTQSDIMAITRFVELA